MKEQKPKNFIDVLEEAKTDICMHYCKQPDKCLEKAAGDDVHIITRRYAVVNGQ